MADRRCCWEDLDQDCLLNIFERVGTESLLLSVPFVCKSWHTTTLSPRCFKHISFPTQIPNDTPLHPWTFHFTTSDADDDHSFDYFTRRFSREFDIPWSRFSVSKVIRFVIDRSRGEAQFLKLPGIVKCYTKAMKEVLEHVSKHCKDFRGLEICGGSVHSDLASDIVEFVPRIKCLCLKRSEIERGVLIKLIQGCKELEVFDVRDCVGFSESDKEIEQLGSHIGRFLKEGGSSVVKPLLFIDLIRIQDFED